MHPQDQSWAAAVSSSIVGKALGGQAGHDGGGGWSVRLWLKVGNCRYYLFSTQLDRNPSTNVYRSDPPPHFVIEDDAGLVATLPIAAPEIFEHDWARGTT